MSEYQEEPREYLYYDVIKAIGKSEWDRDYYIEIKCYDHSFYFSCPNPNDEQRVDEEYREWKLGYTELKKIYITKEQFDDPNNWCK